MKKPDDFQPMEAVIEGLLDDMDRRLSIPDVPIVDAVDPQKKEREDVLAKAEIGFTASFMCSCGTEIWYFHPGFESRTIRTAESVAAIICDECGERYDAEGLPW